MVTRLLEYKTRFTDPADVLTILPWIPTGWLTASAGVKDVPGLVGGIIMREEDNDGDQVIKIWDSEDSATTDDVEIARVYGTGVAGNIVTLMFPLPGVEAEKGIYVELSAGDAEFELYYR